MRSSPLLAHPSAPGDSGQARLAAWLRTRAGDGVAALEQALLGGGFWRFAVRRLWVFLFARGWATALHVVELTFLAEIFSARSFVASLALQNATLVIDAFWWGALEGLRRRIRAIGVRDRRAGADHPIHDAGVLARPRRLRRADRARRLAVARRRGADDAGRLRAGLPLAAGARHGAARVLLGRLRVRARAPAGVGCTGRADDPGRRHRRALALARRVELRSRAAAVGARLARAARMVLPARVPGRARAVAGVAVALASAHDGFPPHR